MASVELGGRTVDLWNIRTVPGSIQGEEKIKILENTYQRIRASGAKLCILAGDFNAPKDETPEGTVIPWGENKEGDFGDRWRAAERNLLTGLDEVGMVDVFRTIHGYGDLDVLDISYPTSDSDPTVGRRFDHILASVSLAPQSCVYDDRGLDCSDHTPIIAEFAPDFLP